MTLTLTAGSASELFARACRAVLDAGRPTAPRGLPTVEVLGASLALTDPRRRLVDIPPARVINPAFAAAEMAWILSGSDAPWIYTYNGRLADYADDGRLMGAYGPRLRRWHGTTDQLAQALRTCLAPGAGVAAVGGVPAGEDVGLYRFTSDLRWYVLAESLEERFLAGQPPAAATMAVVRACLDKIRRHGSPPDYPHDLAEAEHIDIQAGLTQRQHYRWDHVPQAMPPKRVVVIVGAPRSGTSHLFNLLAATGRFAYFTTASCWAWPVRNLHHPDRHLFTSLASAVLEVDNKRTRIIPGLIMPGEAEDTWHRAMPVYRHIRGHHYDLTPRRPGGDPRILDAGARAHLAHQGRDVLLVKSPFSSFRIPQIERHWGTAASYIHIIRDQRETVGSIRRNHFQFTASGRTLSAEEAWSLFTDAVKGSAPSARTTTVSHSELVRDAIDIEALLDRHLR